MARQDSELNKFYGRLLAVFAGGLVLALVVFAGVLPLVNYLGKPAYLEVRVEGGVVEIDGVEYRNAVHAMEPGSYVAEVRSFDDDGSGAAETVSLELERNQTTGLYMIWDEGWRYLTAEEVAHRQAIGEVLPVYLSICEGVASRVNCEAVTVEYKWAEGCGGGECVVISGRGEKLTEKVLAEVRGKLRELGYELGEYKYIYVQSDK